MNAIELFKREGNRPSVQECAIRTEDDTMVVTVTLRYPLGGLLVLSDSLKISSASDADFQRVLDGLTDNVAVRMLLRPPPPSE